MIFFKNRRYSNFKKRTWFDYLCGEYDGELGEKHVWPFLKYLFVAMIVFSVVMFAIDCLARKFSSQSETWMKIWDFLHSNKFDIEVWVLVLLMIGIVGLLIHNLFLASFCIGFLFTAGLPIFLYSLWQIFFCQEAPGFDHDRIEFLFILGLGLMALRGALHVVNIIYHKIDDALLSHDVKERSRILNERLAKAEELERAVQAAAEKARAGQVRVAQEKEARVREALEKSRVDRR